MNKILIIIGFILCVNLVNAQVYKFGKVSKEELTESFYPLDSSANAAILYKKRRTYFNYIQGQGFQVVTEVHERFKLYNNEGFDWATKQIEYYKSEAKRESVSGLKATTYNLENNKIVKTNLSKKDVFDEEINRYWSREKFTMPNIKAGSIVEWKYKINSPLTRIAEIQFQYSIPVKKIEAKIETPEYYVFKKKYKGYYSIESNKERKSSKIVITNKSRDGQGWTATTTSYSTNEINLFTNVETYQVTNVPALIEEAYVNNIDNYLTAIQFELSEIHWPQEPIKFYSNDWNDVTKSIYDDSDFVSQINRTGHFEDDLALVLSNATTDSKKIVAIFELVKQKIKWNNYNSIWKFHGTRKAYKDGVGNVSDINLNLVAMLKKAGFKANPVILSTRSNGIPLFPTIQGFNYVIAAVEMENGLVLLDATDPYSTPNNLPLRDLNWKGRLIRKDGSSEAVELSATNTSGINATGSVTINAEGAIEGMLRNTYTNLEAQQYRERYGSTKDEDIIGKIEATTIGIEIGDFRITNKKKVYKPLVELYKFSSENMLDQVADKIYFNPLLFKGTTKNPFTLEKREYPVDFGSPISEKYSISYTIPEGYQVESVPESMAIGLSEEYGFYKFKVSVVGNKINVFSQLEIRTAVYPSFKYQELKEFFKALVNKNSEKIVLKRV